MKYWKHLVFTLCCIVLFLGALFWVASLRSIPPSDDIRYGVTFSKFRAEELRLEWKPVYEALLTDLGVKRFRLVAHWDMVEPVRNEYNFEELDYQMRRAEEENARVILAVGRRLPSWPECHEPEWIDGYSLEEQRDDLFEYMTRVVERYKDSPALVMWQVENEPFILFYGSAECGSVVTHILDEQIALVRALDPNTPILLTASGEIGLWNSTWERGDVFGTTLYRWVYSGELGRFITYPTTPGFFRAKRSLTEWTTGERKPAILAELAAEPWLNGANVDATLEAQLQAMNVARLQQTVDFAARTSFDEQYFWGAEWWYYLRDVHGRSDEWEWARQFFDE
jgi:hypothetical protein